MGGRTEVGVAEKGGLGADYDAHLYSAATPCYRSMFGALGRVVATEYKMSMVVA